ncbi:IS66 family insertion sequence element accessory protein TnpB [Lapidilactobacillus mulanensis]|uniref:IS66 family insertion sequence element accessory protein TnpB n=2 Tax=Lactobacillaceae TaxID=33958 RepID=A0ABW4DIK6_9LACO
MRPYFGTVGFLLLYKRIENGRLQWPTDQNALRKLNSKQLAQLLSGWSLDTTTHQTCPYGHERRKIATPKLV